MFTSKRMLLLVTFMGMATIGTGCATESDAFRRMSAEQHEQAAANPSESIRGSSADEHATEARRLRAFAESACLEVPDSDRDLGPLAKHHSVTQVQTLRDRPYPKEMLQPIGVALYLRASSGMTAEWLHRVLECHLAYHAVIGERVPDPASPLFVDDAKVALSSAGDGFRIAITTTDVAAAREIIAKAYALVE